MNDKVILNKEEFIKVGMFKITPGEENKKFLIIYVGKNTE